MKKRIKIIGVALLLLVQTSLTAFASDSLFQNNGEAIKHCNIYAVGNQLLAKENKQVDYNLDVILKSEYQLVLEGTLENKKFLISAKIVDGMIEIENKNVEKYELKAILWFEDELQIIFQNSSNIYIIREKSNKILRKDKIFYNPSWYTELLEAKIERVKIPNLKSGDYNTHHEAPYERDFEIFGETYIEYIVLNFDSFWPSEKSTAAIFEVTLNILEKYTEYYPYQSSMKKWNDCSLDVAGAEVNFAADEGEYFRSIQSYYEGEVYGTSRMVLNFWLGIPKTPLGITTNYEKYKVVSGSEQGYRSFTNENKGELKVKKEGVEWDSYKIHLTEVNDKFQANVKVATYDTFKRKGLEYRWDYCIVSSGVNSGIAVPSHVIYDSFHNTLFYEVKR